MNNARSVATLVVAPLVAVPIAVAGSDGGAQLWGAPVMVWCGVAAFVVNWVAFVPAWLRRTERYFDLTGTATYLVIVALGLVAVGRYDARSLVLGALVAVWTLRLGIFLFRRILAAGSDTRFERMLANPLEFLSTWTLQGLWAFLTSAAALGAITAAEATGLSWWVAAGAAVWLLGMCIEAVADRQKRAFRSDPANDGEFITTGLWAWSRHPNYVGEVTLWLGVALVALGGLDGWRYVTLVSPVFVFVLLRFGSGVPLLERSADRRWGDREDYRIYRDHTPVFFPVPAERTMIRRRLLGIVAVGAVALGLTIGAVVVFPVAVVVDLVHLRRKLPLAHLLAFAWCWAWLEVLGVLVAGWLWITFRSRDLDANYRLQAWWAGRLMGALRTTCGLQVHISGAECLDPGPVVLLVRHASLADSLLTNWAITQVGLRPRVVMKKELLVDPCLDIVGNRLPNCFVDRGAADSGPELAAIADMAAGLGPDDAAVIFPEGTRANDDKRARAVAKIAAADPDRADRLRALTALLPPRPSGAAALLAAAPGADVVVGWHVGFEGLDTMAGILAALARPDRDVHIEFRRIPRREVPDGEDFTTWLDGCWLQLDREVARAVRR